MRKKRATLALQIDKVAGPVKVTVATPDADVECMNITVWCKGVEIPDVFVDGGAMIDVITKDVVEKLDLDKDPSHNLGMRLADYSLVPLESFPWLDVSVQGIVSRVRAFVKPVTVTYKILLSRRWLTLIKGVEHHATDTLIIQGIDGGVRSTKGRPALPGEPEIVKLKEALRLNGTKHRDDEQSADKAGDALLLKHDD